MMAKLIIASSILVSLVNSSGEKGSHEEQAINRYCDAWVNNWPDNWDGIDVELAPDSINSEQSYSPSNIYDTYYASECQRVRRPWNSMSDQDRSLYIDGLLELRKKGELKMELDEFIAIATVHDELIATVTHHDSDYMFWHGYLIWELESRIRNLGGKYKCFGMPYWDVPTGEYEHKMEYERMLNPSDLPPYEPNIFKTGLGGFGDPNDQWRVNGFSWDVTTTEFWSINHELPCTAEGDDCPICSVKRIREDDELSNLFHSLTNPEYYGEKVSNLADFVEFQQWMVSNTGLPNAIDSSYDPIWYLFHSWQSYLQAMWVNCNDYDGIDVNDLVNYPNAFSPYCDPNDNEHGLTVDDCVGIEFNDTLEWGGLLPKREWSYVHNHRLTIKELYSLPKWNIIYDLNGDDFFTSSGLSKVCGNKLNPEWFVLPVTDENGEGTYKFEYKTMNSLNGSKNDLTSDIVIIIGVIFIFFVIGLILMILSKKQSKLLSTENEYDGYGSIHL